MSRWKAAWLVALLTSALVLLFHSQASGMLQDSDTQVLLATIKAKNAPFSWFWSDWPLFNHFYRPIPTLLFEMDQRLYGNWAAGYGWTNAILCSACVLSLFWFLRELIAKPFLACFGTAVFAAWQVGAGIQLVGAFTWFALVVFLIGAVRNRRDWRNYLPASFSILFLQWLLFPISHIAERTLAWLPGRTATTMTLFALLALACYARLERLRQPPLKDALPTPFDLPATKSSKFQKPTREAPVILGGLSILCTALALASYEQAVMVPACLLGVAVFFVLQGAKPQWALQIPFWAILVAYLVLRHQVIPPGTSSYQAQQLRGSGAATMMALLDVVFPPLNGVMPLISRIGDEGFYLFFSGTFYGEIFQWIVVIAGIAQLRPHWRLALTGWILSCLAFLPMAFLKQFEHYYYWPMALRTVLVVAAAASAFRLTVIALSPPARQAPPRLYPAPGSLLGP